MIFLINREAFKALKCNSSFVCSW